MSVLCLAHCTAGSHRRQFFDHRLCITESAGELLVAAELLDQWQTECTEAFPLVDVRHRIHQRTQDDLCVILEEIYLKFKASD